MRISSLRLAGFGPFLDEQIVDFDKFADDGIFLLTGKTGAGKSSILDAICFALFASVPRYDGTQQKLRSDFCSPVDPTFVELEFSVGDREFRVRRSPEYERPKLRGGGMTRTPASAELSEKIGDAWHGLAARPVDVAPLIASIVGLTKEQFLQVILLAQNRFNRFLRAGNDDRQAVLRTLFATDRFSAIEDAFAERRRSLETRVTGSADRIDQLCRQIVDARGEEQVPEHVTAEWLEASLAAVLDEVALSESLARERDTAHSAAEAELRLVTARLNEQLRRTAAIERRRALGEAAASVDIDRQALGRARAAAVLWPTLAAAQRANEALTTAVEAEATARAGWLETEGAHDDVDAVISRLDGELASLSEAESIEQSIPSLEAAATGSESQLREINEQLTSASTDADAIPSLIDAAQRALAASTADAARAAHVEAELARLTALLDHARSATALEQELAEAHNAETGASRSHLDAVTAHHSLLEQRIAGRAAELATLLSPGEPCAVCGSEVHPSPAQHDSAVVSQEDIDAALARAERLRGERDAVAARRQALDIAVAQATAATEGRSIEQLESAVADATEQNDLIRAAVHRVSELEGELTKLQDRHARLIDDIESLRERRDQLVPRLARESAALDAATKRISEALDGFATVARRIEYLRDSRSRAVAMRAAANDREARERSRDEIQATLVAQLHESVFAGEEEAREARLADSDVEKLERSIALHDQETAAVEATILELAHVPTDDADVDGAETRARESRAALDEALAHRGALRQRAEAVASLVSAAQRELAASESLLKEFAIVRELAQAVAGKEPNTMRMRLETYVLAAQLEEIVAAANARLRTMTSGRFSLQHDDSVQFRNAASGLGLVIFDEHSGRVRATQSLSGGETFLASLALALGLAEVVTNQAGGITLDTLFIDEGFGSLDTETLDVAMSTLDGLRAGGRTIGLISHVESMKEQIPAKLRVSTDARGHSHIETEVF